MSVGPRRVALVEPEVQSNKEMLTQVERVLRAETLQNSDTLKRLLRFLAEKSAAGEADQLKEYTIAVDALEKPSTYDPRHDSAVRIQIGRLRQKLAEYYRIEGKDDPFIVDVPKGHFKLTCESRPQVELPLPPKASSRIKQTFVWAAIVLCLIFFLLSPWSGFSILGIRKAQAVTTQSGAKWTPELEQLWAPFLSSDRPLIVAIEDPLFVELQTGPGLYYRDKSFDDWNQAANSPGVKALQKTFGNPNTQPSRYYTTFGEVNAAFLIGRLLGSRESNLAIVRTSELSWQQLANNNVAFIGTRVYFDGQIRALPLKPELTSVVSGIQNLHPKPGEPDKFVDSFLTAPVEAGDVYALVSHAPGPVGSTDIESFMSNRAAGYVGAVQWFTDPNFARTLVANLTKEYGKIPRYYQVVLKVQFKDEVPIQTSYIMSRELK